METINSFGIYCSVVIVLLSVANIKFRLKRDLFLTGVTGLHITFLFFFGVGSIFYALFGITTGERISRQIINQSINLIYPYLLAGYAIISLNEYRNKNKINEANKFVWNYVSKIDLTIFCYVILGIAYTGFLFIGDSVSNSGVGTIFPVVSNFLFPVSILIVYNLNKQKPSSLLLFVVLIVLVGLKVFNSSWRSQLFIFLGCILIGWSLRRKVNYYIVGLVATAMVIFLLPFQQIKKKSEYNIAAFSQTDASEAFKQSLDYNYQDRLLLASSFFAERINYTREMGYVQNAIQNGKFQYRNGETYFEATYQLIPREFWPAKPSYNYFTGYQVPRIIGVLGVADESSSWAVTCFGEFIYNFSYKYLPVFLILLYCSLNYLDKLALNLRLLPEFTWLLKATLFFLSINLVSVIFSSTYFLWTFLTIIIFNSIKSMNYSAYSSLRRNRA